MDRGTQHSDMFLRRLGEEGREGVCVVPGQATALGKWWEGGQRVWGWWGAPARAPSGGQRTPANGSHMPSGALGWRMQSKTPVVSVGPRCLSSLSFLLSGRTETPEVLWWD